MSSRLGFVERRPLLFAVLATLGFALVIAAGNRLGGDRDDLVGMLVETSTRVVVVVLAIGTARALGWTELGFGAARGWRAWVLVLAPLLYLGTLYPWLFTGSIGPNLARPRVTALVAVDSFVSGFCEDLVYRGLVLFGLLVGWRARADAVGRAAVVSSLLFSLPHLTNLLAGHQPLRVGAQLLWAFVLGVAFAYLAVLVRSVWPAAVLHGLLDAVVVTNRIGKTILLTPARAALMVLASLPVLAYAMVARRRWRS